MEKNTLKYVNKYQTNKITFSLVTSCGQNSKRYFNSVLLKITHLWQLIIPIFLHRYLKWGFIKINLVSLI
jgi:hypothetical protein